MYKGKQPLFVISLLVSLIVILGVVLSFFLFNKGDAAITGNIVVDSAGLQDVGQQEVKEELHERFAAEGRNVIDFSLKEEISVGEYKMAIMSIKTTDKIGTYLSPDNFQGVKAKEKFYVIQMYIKNTGKKEGYIQNGMFQLTDGEYVYNIDEEATKYLFESSIFYPVLRTGLKRNVKAAFDVREKEYYLLVNNKEEIYRMKI